MTIQEATNGEETTEIYKIKSDGWGRTKTVIEASIREAVFKLLAGR